MKKFSIKPNIYFQKSSVEYLKELRGKKALIITDSFMVQSGYINRMLRILENKGIDYEVFSDVKPDPPIEIVAIGVKKMQITKPDVVIALGGGSSIDAAKSIIMIATDIIFKEDNNYTKPLFVAIPTTSGTGSEVTDFSVITFGDKKVPLVDEMLLPDVAILDADFVKSVPSQITADTAIDALTHAIEAYVSMEACDFTDALAEKSIKIIFEYFLRAYRNGEDMEAREKIHNASCMAGVAFANASLGINHSMAHALGGAFHIPHGRANAILLPYVIMYNANLQGNEETRAAKRYSEIAKILGLPSPTVKDGVFSLISAIKIIMKESNTPLTLKQAKIDKREFISKIDSMADTAMKDRCTVYNPRVVTKEDIRKLFVEVYGE
ncbi:MULTISPECIES: 1-propanol dehydrogenase PduQ [Clostridium]|uniref:Aldehyde-alcohol dehydrogenase n=2 Tax=Clostridium TaxID=1485 RepID=A0A151AQ20_9CLOT|nr:MULTISPECIES: 1-propanol dehydrogenase PduQ [Clostridium]KYH29497.1 aldehyde-alcohol dehydrogenase [Clostridium colicanis DSM 13634]PRR70744.1 Aldehyde-alcohol dehydrogenase [Clostridium thermopalmarium DSM 5974]PVZ22574.1 alcohol dehydrogenase class IV [Clostridium thermopalmarium DSM 5974]